MDWVLESTNRLTGAGAGLWQRTSFRPVWPFDRWASRLHSLRIRQSLPDFTPKASINRLIPGVLMMMSRAIFQETPPKALMLWSPQVTGRPQHCLRARGTGSGDRIPAATLGWIEARPRCRPRSRAWRSRRTSRPTTPSLPLVMTTRPEVYMNPTTVELPGGGEGVLKFSRPWLLTKTSRPVPALYMQPLRMAYMRTKATHPHHRHLLRPSPPLRPGLTVGSRRM